MNRIIARSALLLPLLLILSACSSSRGTQGATAMQSPTQGAVGASSEFQLDRVTFAVVNVEGMIQFYQQVFNMRFRRVDGPGVYLYEGKLFGLNYLLVPNDYAGVRAEQSRHQMEFKVADVDAMVRRATMVGGTLKGGIRSSDDRRTATVLDPDGNTLVFFQED